VQTPRAWIAFAAVGWALAIFAGGVLLGDALDDETGSKRAPSRASEASTAVLHDGAGRDAAKGEPLRVALRDVRGELAIGQGGGRSTGEPGPSGPAAGGAEAAVLASRAGAARAGAVPAGSPAVPGTVRRQPAGGRRTHAPRGQRRGQRRRGRPPSPPAAPVAPFKPPPAPADDGPHGNGKAKGHFKSKGKGKEHGRDGKHGRGHGHGHD
jgi:hypothetical protein